LKFEKVVVGGDSDGYVCRNDTIPGDKGVIHDVEPSQPEDCVIIPHSQEHILICECTQVGSTKRSKGNSPRDVNDFSFIVR
jgi:hypothetical protein